MERRQDISTYWKIFEEIVAASATAAESRDLIRAALSQTYAGLPLEGTV